MLRYDQSMKLSTLQENLSKSLLIASRLVATRAQLPVLGNVLLSTDSGRLKISATNLETGINLWIGASLEEEGSISVPAKILTEFVSSLPADKVNLEVRENSLFLKCNQFQADFISLPASEFPNVPTRKGKESFLLDSQELVKAVSQAAFAAASDEGRPVLTGVLLTVKDKSLNFAATDGYRLSVKKTPGINAEDLPELEKGLIIPSKALIEVAKIMGNEEKKIGVTLTKESNQVIFSSDDVEVVSRLIEGEFPNLEKIIPQSSTTKVILEKETFLKAVKMAAIFARESANFVKLSFQDKKLSVSANSAQVGNNLSEIEAQIEGEANKIAFNSRYLLDFLGAVSEEQIRFEMTGPLSAGIFRLSDKEDFTHVIMPVRVQE